MVTSLKVVTEPGCRRITRFAFEYALEHGGKRVTLMHKANIMKVTDGMFLRVAGEVASDYPDIQFDAMIVDAASMQLLLRPDRFDVILAGNLYGGILADLGAGIVGGISATMGSSRNEKIAVFEAIHGEAPELTGKNRANLLPMLMPAVYMLRHLGQTEAAGRILTAVTSVLKQKIVTPDLGGRATTTEMADAVIKAL
jgi:isocitrate dehydrogenase (NAD+)